MPESAQANPVEIDELLARLRQVEHEWEQADLPAAEPLQTTRSWLPENLRKDQQNQEGLWHAHWTAQAAYTEALEPLLLSDTKGFITLAYQRFLGREPDASGIQHLTAQLTRHIPRAEVLAELALSEESLRLQPHGWLRWRWFGRLLRLVLHAPLVGSWARARLQWLARGVLRRTERWLTRRAQSGHWSLFLLLGEMQEARLLCLQQQLTQQLGVLRDMGLHLHDLGLSIQDLGVALHYLETKKETQEREIEQYMAAFEQHFRGSEEDLRVQLARDYVPFLHAARERSGGEGPCLDLGCGRGTWLALLRDEQFIAKGVDTNAEPVALARAQGLDAAEGDALGWLQTQPANSALAVTAFHLVEHLPFALRLALTKEIKRVLRPGGVLIYETPNPENIWVGAHTFYHDPTHATPITPASLSFMTKYCGFVVDIYRLHPGPLEEAVAGEDALSQRLNQLTCSAQDYAIVAYKPVDVDANIKDVEDTAASTS